MKAQKLPGKGDLSWVQSLALSFACLPPRADEMTLSTFFNVRNPPVKLGLPPEAQTPYLEDSRAIICAWIKEKRVKIAQRRERKCMRSPKHCPVWEHTLRCKNKMGVVSAAALVFAHMQRRGFAGM